jgi:hypothetical protein
MTDEQPPRYRKAACEGCGGPLVSLGALGSLQHLRCRACGLEHHRRRAEAPGDPLTWLRDATEEGGGFVIRFED